MSGFVLSPLPLRGKFIPHEALRKQDDVGHQPSVHRRPRSASARPPVGEGDPATAPQTYEQLGPLWLARAGAEEGTSAVVATRPRRVTDPLLKLHRRALAKSQGKPPSSLYGSLSSRRPSPALKSPEGSALAVDLFSGATSLQCTVRRVPKNATRCNFDRTEAWDVVLNDTPQFKQMPVARVVGAINYPSGGGATRLFCHFAKDPRAPRYVAGFGLRATKAWYGFGTTTALKLMVWDLKREEEQEDSAVGAARSYTPELRSESPSGSEDGSTERRAQPRSVSLLPSMEAPWSVKNMPQALRLEVSDTRVRLYLRDSRGIHEVAWRPEGERAVDAPFGWARGTSGDVRELGR